jgi:transcriptional regulator with XRE-family HTH domain
MTTDQFRRWMARRGHTLDTLAEALAMSRRQIAYYRSGEQAIPRVVELALRVLATTRKRQKRPDPVSRIRPLE